MQSHKNAAEFAESSFGIIEKNNLDDDCYGGGYDAEFFPESADIVVGETPGFIIFHRAGCAVADNIVYSFRAMLLHKDSADKKKRGHKKIASEEIPFKPHHIVCLLPDYSVISGKPRLLLYKYCKGRAARLKIYSVLLRL